MTPPINIDGSTVTGITIDGTSVSEVTVDGSTVFSAIPDSVVNRWPLDEGSGTTARDSVGGSDVSLNGPTWVSDADAIGGYLLSFDGSDDFGESNATASAGSMSMPQTVEFGSNITSIQVVQQFGPDAGTAGYRCLRFRGDQSTNQIEFVVTRDSDASNYSASATLSTGTKQRVVGILDISVPEIRLAIDASVVDTTAISGNFQNVQSESHAWGYEIGGNQRYYGGNLDEPMQDESAWDSQTLTDDYQRQPWS
jgi:hypothetical protein